MSILPVAFAALLSGAAPKQVTVAAAANLAQMLPEIGRAFESASGIHPVFSFGSTAQLAQQIESGAPFDVFMAADSEHPDDLIAKGYLLKDSRAIYATGVLALWIPPQSKAGVTRVEDLARPDVRVIAIARPELAPYGQASVETLTHLGIWDRVKPKVVYAGSIAMAKQFGVTGNADAVFTALSLLIGEHGRVLRVDESLHKPLTQALGIVSASKNQSGARAFAAFLASPGGRTILTRFGYR